MKIHNNRNKLLTNIHNERNKPLLKNVKTSFSVSKYVTLNDDLQVATTLNVIFGGKGARGFTINFSPPLMG